MASTYIAKLQPRPAMTSCEKAFTKLYWCQPRHLDTVYCTIHHCSRHHLYFRFTVALPQCYGGIISSGPSIISSYIYIYIHTYILYIHTIYSQSITCRYIVYIIYIYNIYIYIHMYTMRTTMCNIYDVFSPW